MFSINGRNLPSVSSYRDAEAVFERSGPVKGYASESDTKRALVRKSDTSKIIIKRGDDYAFRYHRTDLVTWHSADRLTIVPWDSVSSRIFSNAFTPPGVCMSMYKGNQTIRVSNEEFIVNQTVQLAQVGGKWAIENMDECCEQQFQYIVDQKLARPAREKVNDYMNWCRMARKGVTGAVGHLHQLHDAARLLLSGSTKYSKVWNLTGNDSRLMQAAVIQAGAVEKVPAPMGLLVAPSIYSPFV